MLVAEALEDRTLLSSNGLQSLTLQQGVNGYTGGTSTYTTLGKNTDVNNYGTSTVLLSRFSVNSEDDALLGWNLTSQGINSNIQSATITLNVTSASTGSGTWNLYALTGAWNPNTVDWDTEPGHGTTVLGTMNATTTPGPQTLTLNSAGIAQLQSWLNSPSTNYGFVLLGASTSTGILTVSSNLDPTPANHPALTINTLLPGLTVSAGPNQGVDQAADTTLLNGTVTDSDPANTPVTSTWSVVSGPGTVTFQNPNSLSTGALFSGLGTYVLQLSASDGNYSASSQVTITVAPPPPDIAPTVVAGSNQTITMGQTLNLTGQATDNGPNPLTVQWMQLSGPGVAMFGSPQSASSTVQFTAAGTYILDLTATDGTLASNSTLTVTVNPASSSTANPPVASAGTNQTVNLGTTVNLSGTVTYTTVPGATLTTLWQVANGPGTVTFGNTASEQTTATFSAAGTYYLRFLATYAGQTDQSFTIITVNQAAQSGTFSLQQGTNGYTGATDSYISENNTSTNYGTSTTLSVTGPKKEQVNALLEWNLATAGVTGTVQSASITVYVTSGTSATFNLYALDKAWNASQVTWFQATSTVAWQGGGASGSADYNSTVLGTLQSSGTGFATIKLNAAGIAVLQSWLANPSANNGFILEDPVSSDNLTISFASSKYATVADRPLLSITTQSSGGGGGSSGGGTITNPAASASVAVNGTSGTPNTGFMAGVGLNLATLYYQYVQWQQNGSTGTFTTSLSGVNVSGTNVSVFVNAEPNNVSALTSSLQSLGMSVTLSSGNEIGGWLPIGQIANAAILHGLVTATPAAVATLPLASGGATATITPTQMRTAYGVTGLTANGAGQTIAIVDAFNDPNILADANSFSTTYGLPQFNVSGSPTLTVLNQTGAATLPANATPGTWDVEESLDVEWAHTIAPFANIILVEANSASLTDLFTAVGTAADLPGVSVVSMSFGGSEFAGEAALDGLFTTPTGHQGVTFLAATGDNGPPSSYPSTSPNVVAVGGTTLSVSSTGAYLGETAWNNASGIGAGGLSSFESEPAYQSPAVAGVTTTTRATPDVSMDAGTPVIVVDTFDSSTPLDIVGTSLSTPMWGGLIALADQIRVGNGQTTLDGATQTLPKLYSLPSSDFHDVTSGSNGFAAGPGYDLATGLGTPIANLLVPDLAGPGQSTATGPSATLSVTNNPFSENGGTATVTATLSAPATAPVTINLGFSGTAVFGTQYTASSTQIVIPVGQTSGSITLKGVNNASETTNLTVDVTILSVQNGQINANADSVNIIQAAVGTPPQVMLTVAGPNGTNVFSNSGTSLTVTATLTSPATTQITLLIAFSGDAVLGTDFTVPAANLTTVNGITYGVITIASGATTGTLVLTGANANFVSPTLELFLTIASISPAGAAVPVLGAGLVEVLETNVNTGGGSAAIPQISLALTGSPIAENGGQMTLTVTESDPGFNITNLAQNQVTAVTLDLSGTAIFGTNYTVTTSTGQTFVSGDQVFLDFNNSFTATLTITGIDDFKIDPTLTVITTVALIQGGQATPSPTAGSVTGEILNVDTQPGVSISSPFSVFTSDGGQAQIVATLTQTFTQNVTVNLAFSGTAVANLDYTVTSDQAATQPTTSIVIPAGSTTGSVWLTGLPDTLFEGDQTVNIDVASVTGAGLVPSQKELNDFLVDKQVPVNFIVQNAVVPEGGVASVVIEISRPLAFPVSVHYATQPSAVTGNQTFTGTITFAAGQTSQTIFIPTVNDGSTNATQAFSISLSNPVLNAPTGVEGNTSWVATTGTLLSAPATVTVLDSIQVPTTVVNGPSNSTGLPSPPDIAGADGDGFVVLMLNGLYSVYSESGNLEAQSTLTQFWTNAGATLQGTPIVPRVIYVDGRWIAVALDQNIQSGVEQPNNNILLAISNNSDPTQGWKAFTIASDPAGSKIFATSVALGFGSFGALITTNMSNGTESLATVPAASLFGTTPSTANLTQIENLTTDTSVQPELALDGTFETTAVLMDVDSILANTLGRFDVLNAGSTTTAATVSGPAPITVSPSTITAPGGATQPGTTSTITDPSGDLITANAYQVGDDIWVTQTVKDPTTGNSDIQWFEISYSTSDILQHGLISDPVLNFYDPSIAVNGAGDVVIGFTGSGSGPGEFASAFAVMGQTTNGVTTFTTPIMLRQGTADYGVNGASNTWANYSSTVVDNSDPTSNTFWTFQEVATGTNTWTVEAFQIAFTQAGTSTGPTVTLSSSANSFLESGVGSGGSVTVTATLSAVSATPVTIDLGFAGTALANVDYTIANQGSAPGNSPVQIVIPAGSLTGSVVLTGSNNPAATGNESVIVSITQVNGSSPASPQTLDLSITSPTTPQISIENLTVNENGGPSTASVVVRLSNPSSNPVTVDYATVSGSAIAGTDFTAPAAGASITFAPGTTEQTIQIPLLVNGNATGTEQFSVQLTNPTGANFTPTGATSETATVSLVEFNPQFTIEDTSVIDTSPTTAQVTVLMSQASAGTVTLNFQTTGGTAIAGTNYIAESGPVVFAAGQTSQIINIPILGDQDQTQTETFNVVISKTATNPSPGTIDRSTATVTLFNIQPGSVPPDEFDTASGTTNVTTDTSASGPFAPADPSGAVGPNNLVVFDSDTYQAFNKSTGAVLQSSTLNQFWTAAGLTIGAGDFVGQPHVVFDPSTGRWYASALDQSVPPGSVGPPALTDNLLLAVSKSSDPTQGWVGFEFATDPTFGTEPPSAHVRADFDSLGFNANSVVVTANMYNIESGNFVNNAVVSIPKADLTGASPTVARASTLFTSPPVPSTTTNTFDPALIYDASTAEILLGESSGGPVIESVTGGGGPTVMVGSPTTLTTLGGPLVTTAPVAAPQPAGAAPLTTGPLVQITGTSNGTGAQLDALSSNFTGTIVEQAGNLWAAQTVSSGNVDVIQWMEINVASDTIIQHGLITGTNGLNFYYPSVSVDGLGDVVIGFSGSSLTQQISSYAVYGTTTGGVTTFTNPILLKQGTGIYAGFSNANVASASISATSSTFNSSGTGNTTTITVILGSPAGTAGAVVDLGFSGTALANRDYSISAGSNAVVNAVGAPIELLIPAGQTTGTITLTGLGNALAIGDETLNVSVTSINGTPPAAATSTSLTLVDTTATAFAAHGAPLITAENLAVVESSTSGTSTAQVLVRLSEPVLTPVTVDYSTADGTAVSGTDYTGVSSQSVTFAPGQTVATISITLLDNLAAEGKTFSINFTQPTFANGGRGTLATTSANVTLANTSTGTKLGALNSNGPIVTLSPATGGSFNEDSGTQTVTATLASASTTDTLINLTFSGTATFGSQYVTTGEWIFIPAGLLTGSITLSGDDVPIGANPLSAIVGINTSQLYGAKSAGQTATVTVNPGNVASATISGQVTGNGAALAGIIVYLSLSQTPTQFGTDGDFNPSMNLFTTTDANGNYSFTGLAAGTYTVRELIPSNELVTSPTGDTSTIVLSQAQQTTVNFTNNLTAVWGAYSATALDPANPGVFWTFQAFDDDQTANDFNTWGVQATQLAVTNFTSDTSNQTAEQFNIPVTITSSSNLVTSSGTTVTVSIPAQTTPTTIYLAFGGSAEGNVNYFVAPGVNASTALGTPVEIIIPAGQTSGSVILTAGNSGFAANGAETTLSVSVAQTDGINLGPAPPGTSNTLNLDIGTPTVAVENGVGFETGAGKTASVQVPVVASVVLPAGTTITVSYEILDGNNGVPANTIPATQGATGAVPAATFISFGSTTITAGTNEGFISIPLTGNAIPQAETLQVILTGATVNGSFVPIVASQAFAYILNDVPPTVLPAVSLSLSGSPFSETSGTATVTATLSQATTVDTLVNLAFSGTATLGTATSPGTYSVSGESIVIPAGQTTGSITLTGNDAVIPSTETAIVAISSVSGAVEGSTTQVTASLTAGTVATAQISGTVTDASNNPLAGVVVYLGTGAFNPATDPFTTTNASGFYSFTDLAAGTYPVSELVPQNFTDPNATQMVTVSQAQQATQGFIDLPLAVQASISPSSEMFNTTGADDTDTITATLTAPAAAGGVTLVLGFTGTAVANTDYTISNGSNAIVNAPGTPIEIVIPQGQMTGTIVLTGNNNPNAAASDSLDVSILAINGVTQTNTDQQNLTLVNTGATGTATGAISGTVGFAPGTLSPPVLVYIDENPGITSGTFEPVAGPGINADPFTFATAGTGFTYSFQNLTAGNYSVRELTPEGLMETAPLGDVGTVTVSQGTTQTVDFGDAPASPVITAFLTDSSPNHSFNVTGANDTDTVTVQLTGAAGAGGVTVVLGFSGTAVANTDYSITPVSNAVANVPGTPVEIVIPQGQISGSIELKGLDNPNSLSDDSLQVSIVSINSPLNGVTPPTPTAPPQQISLINNNFPVLNVEDLTVVETTTTTAEVILRLNAPVQVPMTVNFTTVNGTAIAGTDYTPVSGPIPIPAGTSEVQIAVPILVNSTSNGKTFSVDLSSPSRGVLGSHSDATVTLLDSLPPATLPTVSLAFNEPAGPPAGFAEVATANGTADTATIVATLSAQSSVDTVINFTFTSDGAVLGAQYTVTGEQIVIPAGATSATMTITGNDQGTGQFSVQTTDATTFGATLTGTSQALFNIVAPAQFQGGPSISGTVLNQNDQPMPGVYVYLGLFLANNAYQPHDPAYVGDEPFVVTDSSGRFQFTGLSDMNPPGDNYTVSELVPAGYVASFPYGNQYAVNITFSPTTGVTYTNNFLNINSVATTTTLVNPPFGDVISFTNEPGGPADPTGAVGPNDIIQADNNNFVVLNKISGTVEQSMSLNQFWLPAWNQEATSGNGQGFEDVLYNAYEPQVVYDSASGRWYVSSLDNSNPPFTPFSGTTPTFAANDILLAVSKDSNPADGWVEFVIPADEDLFGLNPDPLGINPNVPFHRPLRADSDTLGFNAALNSTAIILTANLYDDGSGETSAGNQGSDPTSGQLVSTMILSIPKEDLLSATTTDDPVVMNNFTSVSEGAYTYGINPQAVVSYDANSPALVLAQDAVQTGGVGTAGTLINTALELTTIVGSGTSFSVSGAPISIALPTTFSTPIPAPQPNHAPDIAVSTEVSQGGAPTTQTASSALLPGLVDDGIDDRLSNVVEVNGDLWVTQTVLDSTNTSSTNPLGTDAIAWWEIQPTFVNGVATAGTVIQHGLITSKGTSDPNLFFYFPSIAVNKAGDVVIGFDGSDSTTFISSYTAVGTTFAGVTTFNVPQLLKSGVGEFVGLAQQPEPGPIGPVAIPPAPGSAVSGLPPAELQRGSLNEIYWGAYSATALDPSNPNEFWTFQSIVDAQTSSDVETWAVQTTRISIDQPSVTLSVSGPPGVASTQQLGLLGDSLSAGDVSGTTPGFAAQLKSSSLFNVPVGANQAVDGALASGLATQLPEIQTLAPSLNYTTIIIGMNDALALVQGNETAAQYINTIESEIEGAITTLQSKAPSDHLIMGTVPDIFVTPAVEGMNLSAATLATDEAVIQQTNAAITSFAVTHGVAVIDLYAAYASLLGSGSLTVGGVTYSTTSTTNPLFASDNIDPSAIFQGLLANMVIDAADVGYLAGLTPITDQQLVTNTGGTPTVTGPTYFNLAHFVLAPDSNPALQTQTITATLSQASAHDVVVNVGFGGAVQGTDYLASSEQIVIRAGQTSGSITLTGLGEPSTLVVAGITSLEGGVENTQQQVMTVLTTPPSIVTLGLSSSTFAEAGGTETVTATLSAPSATGTVIDLSFGGSATLGQDYSTSGETIFIPAGSTTGSITLTGNNNNIAANESVVVTMTSVTGAYSQVPQVLTATLTAGNVTTGSISGSVVENVTGQPGEGGVIVFIDENGNGIFQPAASGGLKADPFTTTAADGTFSFTGLNPGTYTIDEVVPSGFTETSISGNVVNLTQGAQVTGVQFVNTPPAGLTLSLSSLTFDGDVGSTTVTARLAAPATNNVVVFLTLGGTALDNTQYYASGLAIVIPSGQTTGSITLTGIPVNSDSTSSVVVGIAGVINGSASAGTSVTATLNDDSPVAKGELAGTVFQDTNLDGVQDNGEPDIPFGLLFIDLDGTGKFDITKDPYTFSTQVLTGGNYEFFGLVPGSYSVYQIPPTNYVQTSPPNGITGNTFYQETISANQQITNLPFGDGHVTNPPLTLSVSSPTITANGSQATLTASLAQPSAVPITVQIKVGGLAPFTDYQLMNSINSVINLSLSNPTFTFTIPAGQTTATFTITANHDTDATVETITFDIISLQAATLTGSSEAETAIVPTSGTTQLVVDSPSQAAGSNGTALSFTSSGSSTPELGIMGDDLSTGSGSSVGGTPTTEFPNWVTQATSSGAFAVPTNGNEAVSGAIAANLPTQLTSIQGIAKSLNYVVVMMGANDAAELLEGVEGTTTFISTVTTNVENTLTTLMADGLRPIVATVPDPMVTPFFKSKNLNATTVLADEAAIQQANAQLEVFARSHGIPVVDLYGFSQAVEGASSLTLAGTTFASGQLFTSNGEFPAPVIQGLIANMVIDAADAGYDAGLSPIRDQQIVLSAGQTPLNNTTSFFNLSPYVLGPANLTGTLQFTAGNQPDFITSADLNGDGQLDLIVANSQADSLTIVLDPSSANPVTKTIALGASPTAVAAADFNGDGNLDLAVTTTTGLLILQGDGKGDFTVVGGAAVGTSPDAIVVGDFNGDGKMDIAVANGGSNSVSILYGNGNMTFQSAVTIPVGPDPTDIKAADLNGDGKLDLVVANFGTGSYLVNGVNVVNTVAILMNNGNGTFTTSFVTAGVQPHSIAIADFNGDGHPDIAVANVGFAPNASGNVNTVSILLNNGSGQFTPVGIPIAGQPLPANVYTAGTSVWTIAAGDVNGDGRPDIVVTNNGTTDNDISVLLNNGNGTFTEALPPISLGAGRVPVSVATGDFYHNGAIDIAAAVDYGTGGVDGITLLQNLNIPRTLVFHVYLSQPSTSTVTVHYATQNGTGTAFVDYIPESGTLIFAPGQTEETVLVPILDATGNNQSVVLQLSGALNAGIQIGTGVGTIVSVPTANPVTLPAVQATASVIGGNLVINDPGRDAIQIIQISPGVLQVQINGEDYGPLFTGVTGQVDITTPNGLDTVYVDEEVTNAGVVTNPAVLTNSNDYDFMFAELANGANWLLET